MRCREITVAAGLLLATVTGASADTIFTLSGVTLSSTVNGSPDRGTLTGTFTTNDALTSVVSFDITASASGSFPGLEYTLANASVTAQTLPSQFFQIDTAGGVQELRLFFDTPLTSAGTTLRRSGSSYEFEPQGGLRFASGSVVGPATPPPTSVPEPASLLLVAAGLLGAGLRARRTG